MGILPPPTNRSMPPGRIIPELVYPDLDQAVDWLCNALGFTERLRIGGHRSQLVLEGESLIAIGGKSPPEVARQEPDHSIMLRVENVDQLFEVARRLGAKALSPPTDYPYGERQCTVVDIGGHRWTFSQSIADVDPSEWGGR